MSRWTGLGAAGVAVLAGVLAAVTDWSWFGWVAAAGAAVAGVGVVIGAPFAVALETPEARPVARENADGLAGPGADSDLVSGPDVAAIVDPETNLYTAAFFTAAVTTRISAARRHLRPLSVVIVDVTSADGARSVALAAAAGAVERTIRGSDTACRLDGDRFGLLLEDTSEDGAVAFVERLRVSLAGLDPPAVCWAGVACYPTHVFHAGEAETKAARALTAAHESAVPHVEVATAE